MKGSMEVTPMIGSVNKKHLLGEEIYGEMVRKHGDVGTLADRSKQGPLDFSASHIGRMNNPMVRMASLACKV